MRLRCTHGMFAHWGPIFEEGKEYDVIDENFDYVKIRRDRRLSEIGIK